MFFGFTVASGRSTAFQRCLILGGLHLVIWSKWIKTMTFSEKLPKNLHHKKMLILNPQSSKPWWQPPARRTFVQSLNLNKQYASSLSVLSSSVLTPSSICINLVSIKIITSTIISIIKVILNTQLMCPGE